MLLKYFVYNFFCKYSLANPVKSTLKNRKKECLNLYFDKK